MIHFECPSCRASFDVDDRFAGRNGRCKACGGRTKVPEKSARTVAVGAAAGRKASTVAPARPKPSIAAARPVNWRDVVVSQVALAPISADNLKALKPRPSPYDDPNVPAGPYLLASAPSLSALDSHGGRAAGAVTRGYRQGFGKVEKLFRWINQSAYLVSVPFLMCLLAGLALGNHALLVLGATLVVALNLGRIVAGVGNLAAIAFRESPMQGVLFLIPPVTFIYLAQNWAKVRKPTMRIIGPIVTIGFVLLAFMAEPWLHGRGKSQGSIKDQAKGAVGKLSEGIKGKVSGIENLSVESIERKAAGALESLQNKVKAGGADGEQAPNP